MNTREEDLERDSAETEAETAGGEVVGGEVADSGNPDVGDSAKDDFFDKWQRTLAEFDNFRKRTAREKASIYDDGVKEAVAAFLPVIDNLERAVSAVTDEQKGALYEGLEKVLKQAQASLSAVGVTEIDALNKPFDPNLHDGVMHIEDGSLGEHVVAEVFQKGYVIKGRVVRHSMVKVAN